VGEQREEIRGYMVQTRWLAYPAQSHKITENYKKNHNKEWILVSTWNQNLISSIDRYKTSKELTLYENKLDGSSHMEQDGVR
jgi:hypothetical protein